MRSHLAVVALAGVVAAGAGARTAQTSRTDYRPLEHVYLHRYDNRESVKASPLLHARG